MSGSCTRSRATPEAEKLMTLLFALVLLAGLVVGVIAMLGGIDRKQRHGAWVKYLNLPTAGAAAALFGIVGYPLAKYSSLGTAAILAIAGAAAAAAAAGIVILIAGWAVPSAALHVEDPRFALQGHPARVSQSIAAGRAGRNILRARRRAPHHPRPGARGRADRGRLRSRDRANRKWYCVRRALEQYRTGARKAQLSLDRR